MDDSTFKRPREEEENAEGDRRVAPRVEAEEAETWEDEDLESVDATEPGGAGPREMHPRNPYANNPPDFHALAAQYESFAKYVITTKGGQAALNWRDPNACRELARVLLHRDFALDWDMPIDQLCPTIPLRLNYLLWVQDLVLSAPACRGLDIGTGASCIYPLLGVRLNAGWSFLGTDINKTSLEWAQQNIARNNLADRIQLRAAAAGNILLNVLTVYDGRPDSPAWFDFCMCNPPFFSSLDETGLCSKRTTLAADSELVTPGGELQFVGQIIRESGLLRGKITWYTSMLGRKCNLKTLCAQLAELGVAPANIRTTEFVQGRTSRWGLAWTFGAAVPSAPAALVVGGARKLPKRKPTATTTTATTTASDLPLGYPGPSDPGPSGPPPGCPGPSGPPPGYPGPSGPPPGYPGPSGPPPGYPGPSGPPPGYPGPSGPPPGYPGPSGPPPGYPGPSGPPPGYPGPSDPGPSGPPPVYPGPSGPPLSENPTSPTPPQPASGVVPLPIPELSDSDEETDAPVRGGRGRRENQLSRAQLREQFLKRELEERIAAAKIKNPRLAVSFRVKAGNAVALLPRLQWAAASLGASPCTMSRELYLVRGTQPDTFSFEMQMLQVEPSFFQIDAKCKPGAVRPHQFEAWCERVRNTLAADLEKSPL